MHCTVSLLSPHSALFRVCKATFYTYFTPFSFRVHTVKPAVDVPVGIPPWVTDKLIASGFACAYITKHNNNIRLNQVKGNGMDGWRRKELCEAHIKIKTVQHPLDYSVDYTQNTKTHLDIRQYYRSDNDHDDNDFFCNFLSYMWPSNYNQGFLNLKI